MKNSGDPSHNFKPTQITAVDLFAGAGGFSWAALNVGIDLRAAVEIDRYSCLTYKNNIVSRKPDITLYNTDIRELQPQSIVEESFSDGTSCDLVLGGPPCQGFSVHRIKGSGVNDPRNTLIIRYFDFVRALQPLVFLVENVPGLLWDRHKSYLESFFENARDAGYEVREPIILDAKNFGVPQRRRRLFILGLKKDAHIKMEWPPTQTHGKDGSGSNGFLPWVNASDAFILPLSAIDKNAVHMKHSEEMIRRFENTPLNGGSRAESGFVLPCHVNHDGHKDCYGRIDPNKPGPTITTGCINPSRGRFVHPTENHGITARHAARLQTFPEEFVFEGGLIAAGTQIGNAVPIKLGEALLRHISKYLIKTKAGS